jgi:hypothetical protein
LRRGENKTYEFQQVVLAWLIIWRVLNVWTCLKSTLHSTRRRIKSMREKEKLINICTHNTVSAIQHSTEQNRNTCAHLIARLVSAFYFLYINNKHGIEMPWKSKTLSSGRKFWLEKTGTTTLLPISLRNVSFV